MFKTKNIFPATASTFTSYEMYDFGNEIKTGWNPNEVSNLSAHAERSFSPVLHLSL
jgi:hypothetical protein